MDSGSSCNSGGRRRQCGPDKDDPFLALSRYVDSQISSFLQTFTGLPSASRRQPSTMDRSDFERRLNEAVGLVVDLSAACTTEELSRQEDTLDFVAQVADNIFRSHLSPQLFDAVVKFAPALESLDTDTAWPLGYLMLSPYSPLHLENKTPPGGKRWRDAFEDLVAASNNKEMPTRRRQQTAGSWLRDQALKSMKREPAHGVNFLLCKTFHALFCNDLDDEQHSENYQRELERPNDSAPPPSNYYTFAEEEPSTPSPFSAYGDDASNQDAESRSIISSLTTTERTTAPDGTVHTKVVLKKRFADGTEESNETVHMTQPQEQRQVEAASRSDASQTWTEAWKDACKKQEMEQQQKQKEKEKEKGWFWSK